MRKILFRGKPESINLNSNNADWVFGYLCIEGENTEYEQSYIIEYISYADSIYNAGRYATPINSNTLGQYIGVNDKNGVKIFEGDILEFEFCDIGKQKAVVYYNDKYASFLLAPIDNFQFTSINNGKVIGNIYDNPEMTKIE